MRRSALISMFGLRMVVTWDEEISGREAPGSIANVTVKTAEVEDEGEWDEWLAETGYANDNPEPVDWIENATFRFKDRTHEPMEWITERIAT